MYSLNKYAKKEGKYYNLDKNEPFRGIKLPYSSILPYERAKGKIIALPYFTSVIEIFKVAENFSGRKDTQSFL